MNLLGEASGMTLMLVNANYRVHNNMLNIYMTKSVGFTILLPIFYHLMTEKFTVQVEKETKTMQHWKEHALLLEN